MGSLLRHVRRSLGLNLRDAARDAGVSFTYLSQVERGQSDPTDAWLRAYLMHLGTLISQREMSAA